MTMDLRIRDAGKELDSWDTDPTDRLV